MENCRLMRPKTAVTWRCEGTQPAPEIVVEQTLRQAIMNLLNNAADASPDRVDAEGHWDERELCIRVARAFLRAQHLPCSKTAIAAAQITLQRRQHLHFHALAADYSVFGLIVLHHRRRCGFRKALDKECAEIVGGPILPRSFSACL